MPTHLMFFFKSLNKLHFLCISNKLIDPLKSFHKSQCHTIFKVTASKSLAKEYRVNDNGHMGDVVCPAMHS